MVHKHLFFSIKMEREENNFRKFIARKLKNGLLPSRQVLKNIARTKRISHERIKEIINEFKALNVYSDPTKLSHNRKYYRGTSFPSLGHIQIDFAEFHKDLRGYNDRKIGFILSVDQGSLRLVVLPTKKKDTQSWLKLVEEVVQRDPTQTKVITDRDAAVTTAKFRDYIKDKYGVSWNVLHNRNKAYLAEKMVQYVKRLLSIYMSANNSSRWVDYIEPITKIHNSSPIPGTSYSPNQIDWNNFDHYIGQRYKDPNYQQSLNLAYINRIPKEANTIFKFGLGDRVRVNRKVYPDLSQRSKIFDKPSVVGTYGEKAFVVLERGFYYVPRAKGYLRVYTLFDLERERLVEGSFYERDLKLVSVNEK